MPVVDLLKQRDFHNPLPAALRAAAYHKNCRTAHIGQPTRSDVSLNGAKTDKISKPVQHLKFYSIFFKKLRGRGAELPPPRARGGTLYPVKRFFRVNCREAARGGFLQEKKPPCINTEQIPATWQNIQAAKRTLILYAGEPPHKAEYQPQLRHSAN